MSLQCENSRTGAICLYGRSAYPERDVQIQPRLIAPVGSNANAAYRRVGLTQQLLDQATLVLDLAQTRYRLGLGSIVE